MYSIFRKNFFLNNIIPTITSLIVENENIFIVHANNLLVSLNIVKNHIGLNFNLLTCISGVDLFGTISYRFCVVYDLLSLTFNQRLRIKIFVNEITSIYSINNFFVNSNWWEREIWDLFGISFLKHPDLRRLLTDYGFEGHPFRKDFALGGYVEVRYDVNKKQILIEPIELTQDFRTFEYQTPWS
jgi:NADH:ubiquinone oxidoreductase subunit C